MKHQLFLIVFGLSLVVITSMGVSYGDVISPKKQMDLKFSPDDIICKEDLVKLIKKSNGNAYCVEPSSATKLSEYGWTNPLSDEIKSEITVKKAVPAGTINHKKTLNQIAPSGRLDSTPRVNAYNYVFEACAGEKNVRAPEIIVTSDSEVKSIKLASMLKSNQCRVISAPIKANDVNSIHAMLLNKGGITKKINDLESKISDLVAQVNQEKQNLASTVLTDSKKTSEITLRITELKKEINSQRYELQKYNLFLFSDPKKPQPLPTLTSFTGKTVSGMSTDIISMSKQVSQPKELENIVNYNVLFEACTGTELVRIPFVTVSSDYESKDIKIAEKISPNSCQMSATTILAKDYGSITTSISSKQSISSKISEIESSIATLQAELDLANKNLEGLFTANMNDQQLSDALSKNTDLISDLRSKILNKKTEMSSIMLQVYE